MSEALRQGVYLRERHRYEGAVEKIYEHLALNPEDDEAFFELALTQMNMEGQRREALKSINEAVSLSAEEGIYWTIKSQIHSMLRQKPEALGAAETAIQLEPTSSFSWAAKSQALLVNSRVVEAEQAARKALSCDAYDGTAKNLLALALRMRGKDEEAEDVSNQRLEENPEDAWAHANQGWQKLRRGERAEAEGHFRESLRLDPELDYARDGLLQCFQSRSFFYRVFLKFAFFMEKFSDKQRWVLMLGILFGVKLGRRLLDAIHPLAGFALIAAYLLFVFWVFLAPGLSRFLIACDSRARVVLKRLELVDGLVIGSFVIGGFALAVAGVSLGEWPAVIFGASFVLASVPASLVFTNDSKSGRKLFAALTIVVLACGLMAAGMEFFARGDNFHLIAIAGLATMVTTWLSGVNSLREGVEE